MTFRDHAIALLVLVLVPGPAHSQTAPIGGTATEDARLNVFLDKAFDEAAALSPQFMTNLGLKTDYGKLDDYSPAGYDRQLALTRRQSGPTSRARWKNSPWKVRSESGSWPMERPPLAALSVAALRR